MWRAAVGWQLIYAFEDTLQARGDITVVRDARYVVDGNLVTSQGVSAGIDMALWVTGQIYPERPSWHLCHETIYQALYRGARGGLSRKLTKHLRTGRPLRKRWRHPDERRTRYVVPHQRIQHRPSIVNDRVRLGGWEGDLIVGPMSRSAVAMLVDRRSRLLRLIHLPDGHRSDQLLAALTAQMSSVPGPKRLTSPGTRAARWPVTTRSRCSSARVCTSLIRDRRGCAGRTRNTNGLVRQYLRKGTDLRVHCAADLAGFEHKLNNRPRKILGWKAPLDVFDLTP